MAKLACVGCGQKISIGSKRCWKCKTPVSDSKSKSADQNVWEKGMANSKAKWNELSTDTSGSDSATHNGQKISK